MPAERSRDRLLEEAPRGPPQLALAGQPLLHASTPGRGEASAPGARPPPLGSSDPFPRAPTPWLPFSRARRWALAGAAVPAALVQDPRLAEVPPGGQAAQDPVRAPGRAAGPSWGNFGGAQSGHVP